MRQIERAKLPGPQTQPASAHSGPSMRTPQPTVQVDDGASVPQTAASSEVRWQCCLDDAYLWSDYQPRDCRKIECISSRGLLGVLGLGRRRRTLGERVQKHAAEDACSVHLAFGPGMFAVIIVQLHEILVPGFLSCKTSASTQKSMSFRLDATISLGRHVQYLAM